MLLLLFIIVFKGISYYVVFSAMNNPIPMEYALLISSLVMLASLVSIIPGNIGINEILLGGTIQLFNYDFSFVVLVSLVERAALMIVIIIKCNNL